jgi:hypothetical protein
MGEISQILIEQKQKLNVACYTIQFCCIRLDTDFKRKLIDF